jgi:hypothetical protein
MVEEGVGLYVNIMAIGQRYDGCAGITEDLSIL